MLLSHRRDRFREYEIYKWSVISFSIHAAHPLPPGGLVVRIIPATPISTPPASRPTDPRAPSTRRRRDGPRNDLTTDESA